MPIMVFLEPMIAAWYELRDIESFSCRLLLKHLSWDSLITDFLCESG